MSRNARSLSLLSVLVLVGSLVVLVVEAPLVRANTTGNIYFVDNTSDADLASAPTACENDAADGDCSLRQAIEQANANGGGKGIDFSVLPTTDPRYDSTTRRWTISPLSQLPALSASGIQILGINDSLTFTPQVVIDGSSLASGGVGFRLTSSGNVIARLIIVSFAGNTDTTGIGVRITGAGAFDNQVVGSYIGCLPRTLTGATGNQRAGVQIDGGAQFNRVGASGTNRNIISGNGTNGTQGDGIKISGPNTSDTVLENNYIGVAIDSTGFNVGKFANTGFGIQIVDSANNSIGGTTTATRNIISGNGQAGILLTGSLSTGNTINSNVIGADPAGTTAFGNTTHGIYLADGASNNTVTGATGAPLIVAGNTNYGVLITDSGTTNNTIKSAYIGLAQGGITSLPNGSGGVRIQDNASSNSIGTAALGNVISGNTGYGISITRQNVGSANTNANSIRNNIIGLSFSGLTTSPNTLGGIQIDSSARNTIIGGLASGEGNVISGNGTGAGVTVNATAVVSTTISGNVIGLRRSVSSGPYVASAGNQGGGISVASGAQRVQIGGTLDRANTIAFNVGNGVTVGTSAIAVQINSNSVTTNTLGGIIVTGVTTPTLIGNTARANQAGPGIQLSNTPNPTVIGNTASNNSQAGIILSSANGAIVTDNTAKNNTQTGISISSANSAIITNNTVATNGQNGLLVSGSDAPTISFNTVTTSTLNGISVDTSSARVTLSNNISTGNTQSGISIIGSNTLTVTLNTLSRNSGGSGLIVIGPATSGRVINNTVESNGANGMTFGAPGVTRNLTVTGNLVQKNTGSGLLITGDISNMLIDSNQVISNTINGIQLGNGGASPNPQRVRISSNTISRNGFTSGASFPVTDPLQQRYGIVFNPVTAGTPGVATNPNHDIDPPIASSLIVSQNLGGIVYGRVLADGSNAACTLVNPLTDCTLQFFNTDPTSRDGQGSEQIFPPVNITSNGYFTATVGFVPKQLALTATDKTGNTSEFAVFNANPSITLGAPQVLSGKPGDLITISRTIANNGNVSFTKLRMTLTTNRSQWVLTPTPNSTFLLAPGQSRTITVTVQLPTGASSQVRAGSSGLITTTIDSSSTGPDAVQAVVADTINIQQSVVLNVSAGLNGSGLPGSVLAYPHTVTNNGNITTTVTFAAATTDNGAPAPTWVTTATPPSLTLAPGQSGATTVRVTVSPGSQQGKVVQTTLTATPSVNGTPDLTQVKSVIDTTTTTLQQVASMVPDRQADAGATETVQFRHIVTNNSNGTATFKLIASSSQGSAITFTSLTPGIVLVNGNTFSLPNTPGSNTFDFYVNVTVDRRLLPGQKDLITVILTDVSNSVIGGASVQDTINVTRGVLFPRLYLPRIVKP